MRISDWSSDVCSSDLVIPRRWCVPGAPTSTLLDAGDYGRGTLPVQDRWDRVRGVISHPRNTRSEERRVGKECVVRVDLGGCRIIKKNKRQRNYTCISQLEKKNILTTENSRLSI